MVEVKMVMSAREATGDQIQEIIKLLIRSVPNLSFEEALALLADEKLGDKVKNLMLSGGKDFFRIMEDFAIEIPALPRPTLQELQEEYPWIVGIERDNSPTEAVTLQLGTLLRTNEDNINETEYERRLELYQGWLGYQHAVWLDYHQEEFPALMDFVECYIYIEFPEPVVVDASGDRYVLRFGGGESWHWDWMRTSGNFDSSGFIAKSK